MELFIQVEIFRKKSSTFRGITFFPLLRKTIEIFCPICLHCQCQASSREKAKNLPVFCKWYNSFPFLFSVPKKYQYHLTEIFRRYFRTNGKRSWSKVIFLKIIYFPEPRHPTQILPIMHVDLLERSLAMARNVVRKSCLHSKFPSSACGQIVSELFSVVMQPLC